MPAVEGQPQGIRVERDLGPLALTRAYAQVAVCCSRCGAENEVEVLAFADWYDRAASVTQTSDAAGWACRRCGQHGQAVVPIVQHRRGDAAGLLVALPEATNVDEDRAWLERLLAAVGPASFSGSDVVVTFRGTDWPQLAMIPLGPVLVGLERPPLEEGDAWLAATRDALDLPDVVAALNQFVTADSFSAARNAVVACPALIDTRWRLTVTLLGERLVAVQEGEEERETVRTRLGRLDQLRILGLELTPDRADLAPEVSALADRVISLRESDKEAWLEGLRELVDALGEQEGVLLAGALISLVAAMHGDVGRGPDELAQLVVLAGDAIDRVSALFGEEHELALIAALNLATVLEDVQTGDRTGNIEAACAALEGLGPRIAQAGSRLVADLTLNLAAVYSHRVTGSRTDNQETALGLFADAAHLARLVAPDDERLAILVLADQAALYRERLSGSRTENAERAYELYEQAWALEQAQPTLTTPERVLLSSNRANAAWQLYVRSPGQLSISAVATLAREVPEQAATLHRHHHIAMIALLNAGGVLGDLYSETVIAGAPERAYWEEGRVQLEDALGRLSDVYASDHPDRLTALANLGALYGRPVEGRVADADRCEALLTEVVDRAGSSVAHSATAAMNLAQLKMGQAQWTDAARFYGIARESRRRLLEGAAQPLTRLAEIVDAGDLATKHALALVQAGDPEAAVFVLEESRALLRRRGATTAPSSPCVGVAVVHVATSSYGSFGVVANPDGTTRAFLVGLAGREVRVAVGALDGEDRPRAFADLHRLLQPVVDAVAVAVADDVTELAVVVCGALAGAPVHVLADSSGRTWLDRWRVRFMPSQALADELRLVPAEDGTVVAVVDPTGDLAHARSEIEAMRATGLEPREPPAGWSVTRWLYEELPAARIAHFGCHAWLDRRDPLRSAFDLGDEGMTVADIAELRLERLELVVAPACESGAAHADAPDEFLGIAHALIYAGARGVVATLWEIDDLVAAIVVSRFYRELTASGDGAEALARAQRWLAGATKAELGALVNARLAEEPECRWLPYDLATELSALCSSPRHEEDDTIFADPLGWGAFTYLGK